MSGRQYDSLATWSPPRPWEVVTRPTTDPAERVILPEGGAAGRAAGIVFVFLLIQAVILALGLVVLVARDTLSGDSVTLLLVGSGVPLWTVATGLVARIFVNVSRVNVVVLPADPERVEILRFIETRTDDVVPPADLACFLKRIKATGKAGQKSIRGLSFPSGRRGSDAYHTELTQALVDAGLWERSPGGRTGGRLKVTPDEALATLGLET